MSDAEFGPHHLKRNSLGLWAVVFMVISAAAPLTGVAGAIPIAMLTGNGAGVPATILGMTVVMLVFAVGYVAMSKHIRNAGAFFAYSARGLGPSAGGAAVMMALLAYNVLQIGLLGLFGGVAAGMLGGLPWWGWSLAAIALSAVLGYRQVTVSSAVLTVLVLLEYLIVLVFDLAVAGKGGAAGLSFPAFDWSLISSGAPAAAVLLCFGSFIGLEATTIYAEEARDPQRTIPRATYTSILLIGAFYFVTTWLMVAAVGHEKLVESIGALADPTSFFFELTGQYLGGTAAMLAGLLFLSSLFAAVSAFHNYIARYFFVAARDGLLPAPFARTHARFQSPHVGSVAQTVTAAVVVAGFALAGKDPILHLFTWLAQLGVLGVLTMMVLVCLAIVSFFSRHPGEEPALVGIVAPLVAGLVIAALVLLAATTFGGATGTAGTALAWALPALIPLSALLGVLLAARLRARNPAAYAALGTRAE